MSSVFSPTPGERALVAQIFAQADPQKLGVITGEVAVRVFGGAKLQPSVLGEVWSIADEDNKGWLSNKGVAVAVRLMGWAQKGEKVTPALLNKAGPLPVIEGITAVTQHNTGVSLPKSPPPGLPAFTPQDRAKFHNMFMKAGPTNGLLSGEKARDIFVKSKLGNDKLLSIWNLADTQDRGALDSTDFAIGMYFIQGQMSGQLSFIPTSLPPGLYEQAGGGSAASNQGSIRSHKTGNSGSFTPLGGIPPAIRSNIQPQYTGQSQYLEPDLTGYSAQRAPNLPPRNPPSALGNGAFGKAAWSTPIPWDVTPADKANSDTFFDGLDTQRRGYIEGDIAVPFMLESNLPGEVLAQVWDLADINNDGRLTRDGFAVAMYLIQKKLAGSEIPDSLPLSLVPPSMRTNGTTPTSPLLQQHPEPVKDLFSWDDSPPASAAPTAPPNTLHAQQTGSKPNTFISSPSNSQPHDPFGSSSFTTTAARQHLLDDDDDLNTRSPPLHDQSAEIGNVQNQLNSTNRSLETSQNERANVERALADQATQLSSLQTQLASAKASYETEIKLLATLRDRHAGQTADIQKCREELIRAESDLSAVRVEKAEIEGSFLRDKEEARDLHRRMIEAGQQAENMKAAVEKAKKEAKQQKGLLAIAKKQLSTKEAERAKMEAELAQANTEVETINKDLETTTAEIGKAPPSLGLPSTPQRNFSSDSLTFAANHVLPTSPDPSSPAVGNAVSPKSNNPFERLAMASGGSTPRSQSPFLPSGNTSISIPASAEPTTTDTSTDSDPFGFSQAFDEPSVKAAPSPDHNLDTDTPIVDGGASTPKSTPAHILVYNPSSNSAAPTSPTTETESDHFTTPPTTADIRPRTASPRSQSPENVAAANFPALDEPSYFPAIESSIPGQFPGDHQLNAQETDLHSQLKELDIQESDDSDDEDEVPLAELAQAKQADKLSQSTSTTTNVPGQLDTSVSSFDDIFDTKPAVDVPINPTSADESKDAFGFPLSTARPSEQPSTSFSVPTESVVAIPAGSSVPTTVAGVNAFDEAMNKIPSPGPTTAPQFTFDSAFDDDFDFASASASATEPTFPPAPKGMNGHTNDTKMPGSLFDPVHDTAPVVPSREETKPTSTTFPMPMKSPVAVPESSTANQALQPSFDEAFAGFDSAPALNLGNLAASPAPKSPLIQHPEASAASTPFPVATPASPNDATPPRAFNQPQPSPSFRSKSPPPRAASPKPRASTSSSKEVNEKKEPPPRHSKLSIRLPFGKKKKQQPIAEPLPPLSHLTPPQEEPPRTITPSVDDDVESVKQLTAMGFSRTQAVAALERHAYDVQKALNSLLGAQ